MLLIRAVADESGSSARPAAQPQSAAVYLPAPPDAACRLPGSLPTARRDSRGGKNTRHLCSEDTPRHLTGASEGTGLPCPPGTALVTRHGRPTSAHAQLPSPQGHAVYREAYPSCWVTATPLQSLPDFQSSWLISPALHFPLSSKQTRAVFVSLFQTGRRKENQKAISPSTLLCWISNAPNETATIFLGSVPVN